MKKYSAPENAAKIADEIGDGHPVIGVALSIVFAEPDRAWKAGYLGQLMTELLGESVSRDVMTNVERKLRQLKLVKPAHDPKRFKLSEFGAQVGALLTEEEAQKAA